MFKDVTYSNNIPPNFLNSILTNSSLYTMFKDEFEENSEYFQGIRREVYLKEMLKFIEDTLFSSNLFHIYGEFSNLDEVTDGKLLYIKNFYDDFLLDEFKKDPESLLKIRLFRGLEFAKTHDLYAANSKEFMNLYDYIFKESLDYEGIVEVLLKDPLGFLNSGETLSMHDFDILCNYVKNNIDGKVDMGIVEAMLHNHAYKMNHIFDITVAEELTSSTIKSYLETFNIDVKVEFVNGLDSKEVSGHSVKDKTIFLDTYLIEGFVSLNYVELFEIAFYEADALKNAILLERDECNTATLRVVMNMISEKVDMDRIFTDPEYVPTEYNYDLRASGFIKALKFFSSFGVNLFESFITSKTKNMNLDDLEEAVYSKKEISLDQRFQEAFMKLSNKKTLVKRIKVLKLFYLEDGTRKRTIDIIKMIPKSEHKDTLIEYLHSRIIEPDAMIEDVNDLVSYNPKDPTVKSLIEQELKYIYVDTFYYSLDSFIKMHSGSKMDMEEYLDDLLIKINCLKETPLVHRFIDEAIFNIDEAKQNLN